MPQPLNRNGAHAKAAALAPHQDQRHDSGDDDEPLDGHHQAGASRKKAARPGSPRSPASPRSRSAPAGALLRREGLAIVAWVVVMACLPSVLCGMTTTLDFTTLRQNPVSPPALCARPHPLFRPASSPAPPPA